MSNLPERIKELRLSKNMTQEEFGKKFGVVKSTVSLYESGKSTPNDQIKKQICEFFNVSVDYLLGFSDKKTNTANEESHKTKENGVFFFFFSDEPPIFVERLEHRLKELKIAKDSFFTDNEIDKDKITLKDLVTISEKLNISIDYLLGISSLKNIISEDEAEIIKTYRVLDSDNKNILKGKASELKKNQNYENAILAGKQHKQAK